MRKNITQYKSIEQIRDEAEAADAQKERSIAPAAFGHIARASALRMAADIALSELEEMSERHLATEEELRELRRHAARTCLWLDAIDDSKFGREARKYHRTISAELWVGLGKPSDAETRELAGKGAMDKMPDE